MSSIEVDRNSEYTLPPCIFIPNDDEIFGGWKINGEGENIAPGTKITISDNTTLVAGWAKLPTQPREVTAGSSMFERFPSQASSEISEVTGLMGLNFLVQEVYFASSTSTLNFATTGGFVSNSTPFGGTIASIQVKTSSVQTEDADYTFVYSDVPLTQKTTEGGETHVLGAGSSYTFNCTKEDARYFCLSVSETAVEAAIESMVFTYNVPVLDCEFKVYFDANGGSGSFGPYTVTGKNKEELPDASTIGFTAPDGEEFAGWKINGQGDTFEAGTIVGISCDITLVAQWKAAT